MRSWQARTAGDYGASRAGTYVSRNCGVYGATDEENIVGIAVQALSELQDYVSEATYLPWPGVTSQPSPHGQILDSSLSLWYGDPDNPVLTCERLSLAELNEGS